MEEYLYLFVLTVTLWHCSIVANLRNVHKIIGYFCEDVLNKMCMYLWILHSNDTTFWLLEMYPNYKSKILNWQTEGKGKSHTYPHALDTEALSDCWKTLQSVRQWKRGTVRWFFIWRHNRLRLSARKRTALFRQRAQHVSDVTEHKAMALKRLSLCNSWKTRSRTTLYSCQVFQQFQMRVDKLAFDVWTFVKQMLLTFNWTNRPHGIFTRFCINSAKRL